MFCQKCGNKMDDDSKFCQKCGASVSGEAKKEVKVEDNNVVLNVRSKYKFVYESIGFLITIIIIAAFIFIPMALALSEEADPENGAIFLAVSLFILAPIIVIWAITMVIKSMQYKKYSYDFYKTKIVYRDSFLNISEKEVKYKNVKEIIYVQGVIQRLFNIGNITMFTNADSGVRNGILIRSVENVKDVYDEIKKVVNN